MSRPARICGSLLVVMLMAGCASETPPAPPAASAVSRAEPQRLDVKHLPNAIRLHDKVISGGLPEGDAAFAELKELGVRTVISVDGAKPNLVLAKKYGMRYVHLPHGYDGVPAARGKELAKAVRDLPGPIYLHCHHGKHRSPAAAAVGCVSAGLMQQDQAASVLKFAGTNPNYKGLYESAEAARRVDDALLDELQADFPEVADLPPFQEAMVQLEYTLDHLKLIAAAGWKTPADHPDLDPPHEALLLREQFTEMLRTEMVQGQPAPFRELLWASEQAGQELEAALLVWIAAGQQDPPPDGIVQAFELITKNCKSCHETYRDVPLSRKRQGAGAK